MARKRLGLGQAEAARLVGVEPETLYRVETGRQLAGRALLIRIANLYGCSVDFLLGRDGTAPLAAEAEAAPLEEGGSAS